MGLFILKVELGVVVCTRQVSLINDVPVALPTTVYRSSVELFSTVRVFS